MVVVKFAVEAVKIKDTYTRIIGLGIDKELKGEWWYDSSVVIGQAMDRLYWEGERNLPPGGHMAYSSVSLTAEGTSWSVKVWIDGELKGEKVIVPYDSLSIPFSVKGPPEQVRVRLVAVDYRTWEKVCKVVPQPSPELDVTGVPERTVKGTVIEILVRDKATQATLSGAEVLENGTIVAKTDENGKASWPIGELK